MNLNIDVAARFAQVTDALNQISRQAENAGNRMDKAFSAVKTTLQTLGVTLTVGAITAFIKSTIDAADKLNDLSKRSGIAVETLGGIGFAAQQSGVDLETLTVGLDKLNKSIALAKAGNQEKLAVFEALHIDVNNIKSADDAIVKIAGKFAQYEDGANKVALANALGGKSFAAFIPFFDEGSEAISKNIDYFRKFSGITQETAEKADKFNDTMDKLHLLQRALGNTIAEKLLPTLQRLADAWVDAKERSSQFETAAKAVDFALKAIVATGILARTEFRLIGATAETLANQFQEIVKAFKAFGGVPTNPIELMKQAIETATDPKRATDFETALGNVFRLRGENAKKTKEELDEMYKSLDRTLGRGQFALSPEQIDQAQQGNRARRGPRPDAPGLPDPGAKSRAEAAQKAFREVIEAQSKFIVDATQDEAKSRLKVLETFYKDGEIQEGAYWEAVQRIQANAFEVSRRAIEENITSRRQEQAKALKENGSGSVEYYSATKELIQALAARNKLEVDLKDQGVSDWEKRKDGAKEYEKAIAQVNIQLLELSGNTAEAAKKRAVLDSEQLLKDAKTKGTVADEQAIKTRDILIGKESEYLQLRQRAQEVQDRLGIEEERIQNSLKIGAINDIEATVRTDQARKNAVQTLRLTREELEAIAQTPGLEKLAIDAERFGSALDNLEAQSNTLADRARTTLSEGFVDAFSAFREELLSSGKILDALGKAFSRFALRIEQEIENIAAKNLAQAMFGNDGSVVNLFAKLLGAGANGGVNIGGYSTAQGTTRTFQTTETPSYAIGTDFVPNTGLALLHRGEAVIPAAENYRGAGGVTIVQNIRNDSRSDISSITHSMQVAKVQAVAAMEDLNRRRPGRR
jgi:hypothetical protein